jgi:hypothetical protein
MSPPPPTVIILEVELGPVAWENLAIDLFYWMAPPMIVLQASFRLIIP